MLVTMGVPVLIKPNKEQRAWLAQQFGCIRFVWNHYLAIFRDRWNRVKLYKDAKKVVPKPLRFPGRYDLYDALTPLKHKYPWLRRADSDSLQCELGILYMSYQSLFKHLARAPKFKTKKHYKQSYTTSAILKQPTKEHAVKVAKLGYVKAYPSSKISGKIKRMTVEHLATGRYRVTFTVQCEKQPLQKTGRWVGIDIGLDHLLNCSDGAKYDFKYFSKALSDKVHYWQTRSQRRRRLAKAAIRQNEHYQKQHPNAEVKTEYVQFHNYVKARRMVAKYAAKIKNRRHNYLQWLTTYLVRRYDIICIEDIKVSMMGHNHKLARSKDNAAWWTFHSMLRYKCRWYGKALVVVDKDYTSQVCHYCHTQTGKKKLSIRSFYCPNPYCPYHYMKLDRDINAAKNILALGLRKVAPKTLRPLKRTQRLYVND